MYLKLSKEDAELQAEMIIEALDRFKGRIRKGRRHHITLKVLERISEKMKEEILQEVKDATFRY